MDHVDVIKCALSEALPQVKEAHRKYTELQKAFEQLEAKVIPRELVGRKDRRKKRVSWVGPRCSPEIKPNKECYFPPCRSESLRRNCS